MQFVKTEIGADPIVVEGYFSSPPQSVFQAWTDPQIVKRWFGPTPDTLLSATVDLRVGGIWRFVMARDDEKTMGFEGKYLAIEQDRRLVLNWSKVTTYASGRREATPASRVEILLSAKGSGTDIRIIHSAISDKETRIGFTGGWEHGIMNLRALLESAPISFERGI